MPGTHRAVLDISERGMEKKTPFLLKWRRSEPAGPTQGGALAARSRYRGNRSQTNTISAPPTVIVLNSNRKLRQGGAARQEGQKIEKGD